MKSLIDLWQSLLLECGRQCGVSTTRDSQTVTSRVECEGLSFLTITLSNFASDFQKSLDTEFVARLDFQGFAFKSGLPRFLGGFLEHIFDRETGRLLDVPCIDCISSVRQLTLMYSKIRLPCSDERVRRAMRKYVECEQMVRDNDKLISEASYKDFRRMSLLLFGDVFNAINLMVDDASLTPSHGPGATADKLRGNAKFDQREWTDRLERVFPFGENAIPNWRFRYLLERAVHLEPGQERPVRVVTVPKTLKTPRIIAIEPTCMQYMQQAVSRSLVQKIEQSIVRSMIGFTDQGPNQLMAREGSVNQTLATLDLSEASDRVSNQLVRHMFAPFRSLFDAVDATRSRKADVPGYGVIRLAKFASMGSALCFPVEACVFLTLVFLGIQHKVKRQLTHKDIKSFVGRVRVYGDDIIVPTDYATSVISTLESFGMKVNGDKSFWTGKFRESCGKEYYGGHDVSVVKCRSVFPTSRRDVREVVSLVSLRNHLYKAGYWGTARLLDERIRPLLGGHYPVVSEHTQLIGRFSYLPCVGEREHPTLFKPLVKGWRVVSRIPRSQITGEGALIKWFLKRGDEPFADRRHLERSGRPDAVSIKLGWSSPS